MKIHKLLLAGLFAFALTACSDDDPMPTPNPTPTPDNPVTPDDPITPDDNIKSPTPTFGLSTQALTINTSKTYQEMEGFGASDCWLPNTIGTYWTSNRFDIAEALFAQTFDKDGNPRGIGLSMWRVNLGGGTAELGNQSGITNVNNRAESYLTDGKYNWNKSAGQRYFMQQAKNMGVEKYVLFSNTPLVQFTKNGLGRSSGGDKANLKEDCYDDFAEYMAEVAKHFTDEGYNIAAISPVNEPQYNWDGSDQEGSPWQNSEIAQLARELDKSLSSRGLSNTEILLAEAGDWTYLYDAGRNSGRDNQIYDFFTPSSANYVGDLAHVNNLLCGHSYWTHFEWDDMREVRRKAGNAAAQKGIRLWQTEWSMLDNAPEDVNYDAPDAEFQIAQYMSRVIHNDLTLANCTSWSYWTSMSVERWSQRNRFELIKTTPTGGQYSDDFTTGGTVEITPNLWVLGNYSLFVRPGYKRVDLSHKESKNFFATAYIAPDNSKVVVVVTNYDKNNGVLLNMSAPAGTKSVYRYTTTEAKNLQRDQFNVRDDVFVDPASVTTIVYNL